MALHRKPSKEPLTGQDKDVALQKLQEYGERFLALFEEPEQDGKLQLKVQPACSVFMPQPPAQAIAAGRKKKKNLRVCDKAVVGERRQQGLNERQDTPCDLVEPEDEIETIMFNHRKRLKEKQLGSSLYKLATPEMHLKRTRKLFMSSQASRVDAALAETQGLQSRQPVVDKPEDMQLSTEEFHRLQYEVEKFGASALDKKDRKKWKASVLQRIGAKADKAPRMPAFIGLGVAKARRAREARATEEAVAAGMLKRKGLGRKKQELKEKQRDKGLMEAGPGFKKGILFLKGKPAHKSHASTSWPKRL